MGLGFTTCGVCYAKSQVSFIRCSNELDFIKAFSRETCDVDGVPYRMFQWYPEFDEEKETPLVPVWIMLPGLPPNFYHESFLRNITLPLGQYIRQDNSTRCATRTDGARICIKMDASKKPLDSFWIGIPHQANSRLQEVVYETLPAYCGRCRMQGHNTFTCKWEAGRDKKTWVRKMAVKSGGNEEQVREESSKRDEADQLEKKIPNNNEEIGEETGEKAGDISLIKENQRHMDGKETNVEENYAEKDQVCGELQKSRARIDVDAL